MASILALLKSIFSIVSYIPAFLEIFKTIYKSAKSWYDSIQRAKKVEEIKEASQIAKETKDTSKLEAILGPSKNVDIKFIVSASPIVADKLDDIPPIEVIEKALTPVAIEKSIDPEPEVLVVKKKATFKGLMGGSQNAVSVSSVNHNNLQGSGRMGSKFYILILFCFMFMGVSECQNPRPEIDIKIYAGSSKDQGLVRSQDSEIILASDPKFDDFLAISYSDFQCLQEALIINCKDFVDPNYKCNAQDLNNK